MWSYHSSLPAEAKAAAKLADDPWTVSNKFWFKCTEGTLDMPLKNSMFTDGYSIMIPEIKTDKTAEIS